MSIAIDHFMMMEELGQITIYDLLDNAQPLFSVGDQVRVTITVDSDAESYNYFKEYYPEVLRELGEIVQVQGKNQYLVSFAGTHEVLKVTKLSEKNRAYRRHAVSSRFKHLKN